MGYGNPRHSNYAHPLPRRNYHGMRGTGKKHPSAYDEALRASRSIDTVSQAEQDRRMEEIRSWQQKNPPSTHGHVRRDLAGHKLSGTTH